MPTAELKPVPKSELPPGWSGIRFDGALPSHLYRYRSVDDATFADRFKTEVCEELVYLAAATSLNDPEEARIIWVWDGSEMAIKKHWRKILREASPNALAKAIDAEADRRARIAMQERVLPSELAQQMWEKAGHFTRIACFTTEPLNKPMWSHYASGGGSRMTQAGYCIEYETNETWRAAGLHPVLYGEGRPVIGIREVETDSMKLNLAVLRKHSSWSYEGEWRIVGFLHVAEPFPDQPEPNARLQMKGDVRAVIFGLRASASHIAQARELVRAHGRAIDFRQIQLDPKTQGLMLRRLE